MAEDEGTLTGHVKALARAATNTYLATSRRLAKDTLFSTLEDFTRASISQKRLVVVGCTGSGKSTLLNVLSGWRFVQSVKPPFDFCWLPKETPPSDSTDAAAETETASDEGAAAGEGSSAAAGDSPPAPPKPLFESGAAADSVTKCASFANIEWRGDPNRLLTVVDTPGHDDPSGSDLDSKECREALGALAADLHNKLKALGHVHAILVLHNDVASNRLNPATYQVSPSRAPAELGDGCARGVSE